jgi:hypothetical protein
MSSERVNCSERTSGSGMAASVLSAHHINPFNEDKENQAVQQFQRE